MKALLFALICLWASAGVAAPIVNLKSLSPSGDKAILTYDKHWVEVDLNRDRAARSFYPPQGCIWTSIAYKPQSEDLAMVAYCAGPVRNCTDGRAMLMVREEGRRPRVAAEKRGARWSGLYWYADGRRALLIETAISRPVAMGLNDLNKSVQRCGWEAAELKVADVPSGRLIDFDILPPLWPPRAVIAADDEMISASILARQGVDDGSPAADAIGEMCAAPGSGDNLARAVCRSTGYDLVMSWRDGEWRLGAGDWADGAAFHGRVVSTPGHEVLAREDCKLLRDGDIRRVDCALTISREGSQALLTAPDGQFGDLAISGDGRMLASVKSGRSELRRRFDIWDLDTGEMRSLAHLLDPYGYFHVWPPSQ